MRRRATAAGVLAGVVLLTGGCGSTTSGTPTPSTSMTTDITAATAALWDPCQISQDVWRSIGVDPSTLSSDIGGTQEPGFKLCGGHDTKPERTFDVDVWSTIHTVEDYKRKEANTEFVPVNVAGRAGVRYRPAGDKRGDQCVLLFPARQGAFSIDVMKQEASSPVAPCDRAIAVAEIVVPLLPQ
ncbi:DUF3558 family protein [Nocardia pseudovaccinii]|uniref:DUF3558 family protein n=1 Tax=Nocardia pseudovaccinii TaxID=189540 RepID=UPI0014724516|nr:DUF3558 family protein [Nocardia pseudovaccinii]